MSSAPLAERDCATAPAQRPAMGDLPGLVRLSIALRIQPNDGPVFFKVDGQRFGQNRTIKLLTGSSYKVEVKIKPSTLQVDHQRGPPGGRGGADGSCLPRVSPSAIQVLLSQVLASRRSLTARLNEGERLRNEVNISIGGVLVPLELKSKEPDGDRIVYTGTYDTEGVAPTKSGERQPIQITMPFTDIGTFETVWQVKFYNYHKRDHCQWGSPFSVIEYECKPNETRSLMWVNKESFL
ncbi:CB1 cannabinoid receptor-interacting protein 1 isoform X1 [Rhinolophus sinicus]|uniref:CB1 cannabinoid receptor-interacting protein 1 isoform X1 n=2 Tax=Rhinolophus sinicus TaxID=89399 RepID=UPI003D799F4A